MKKVFGVLFLLGALACLLFAYMEAGGRDNYNMFSIHRLFRGPALVLVLGGAVCFVISLLMLFGKKKT